MSEGREIQFIKLFPRPSDFIRWLIDLNKLAHAVEAIDYTENIVMNTPEIDNLLSVYMMFLIRNSDQVATAIEIVQPEIKTWKDLNKDLLNEDN